VDTVDSTNEELRRRAAAGARAGTVVMARAQTAGRGRRGRSWHSPRDAGLYLSLLLRPTGPVRSLTRWTLVGAVAAAEACREEARVAVTIDWPNDLLYRGRKLGGVLVELRTGGASASELILGIGLNVAHRAADFPPALAGVATSLHLASGGKAPGRVALAVRFLAAMGELAPLVEEGRWPELRRRWEGWSPGARGARVTVARAGRPAATGVTDGLAADGALRVRRDDGGIELVRLTDAIRPLEE
jgi:BirA family biotin operon repressor/biotin-[acetyl-CoA-carboxylase] ligase